MVCDPPGSANKRITFVAIVVCFGVIPVVKEVLVGWGLVVVCGAAKFGRVG